MEIPVTGKGKPSRNNPPLVLVVDDEPAICDALARILERAGYRVVIASDGNTALGLVVELKPDLLILDLRMPGMDGRELNKKAHEVCECRTIYFSAVSNVFNTEKSKDLRAEADGVLPKPATMKQILFEVKSALEKFRH